jgi:hypothetical protein
LTELRSQKNNTLQSLLDTHTHLCVCINRGDFCYLQGG